MDPSLINHKELKEHKSFQKRGRRLAIWAGWAAALALLAWVLARVPFADALAVLARLNAAQIGALILLNGLIFLTFSGRWWLILLAQGHAIPYLRLAAYRLAAFGVTYFTPGPQFGGEPLQIFLVQRREGVPAATAFSALALDKSLELLANFAFLAAGVALILRWDLFPPSQERLALAIALGLLAIPLLLLGATGGGYRPLTGLLAGAARLVPARFAHSFQRAQAVIAQAEGQSSAFFQDRPGALVLAVLISGVNWVGMVGEYWLVLRWLGVDLSVAQAMGALTAARLAYLLPLPGGLGVLEASQVLALTLLGFDPAAGIAVSLIIRLRDVVMGLAGLLFIHESSRIFTNQKEKIRGDS